MLGIITEKDGTIDAPAHSGINALCDARVLVFARHSAKEWARRTELGGFVADLEAYFRISHGGLGYSPCGVSILRNACYRLILARAWFPSREEWEYTDDRLQIGIFAYA